MLGLGGPMIAGNNSVHCLLPHRRALWRIIPKNISCETNGFISPTSEHARVGERQRMCAHIRGVLTVHEAIIDYCAV